MASAINHEPAWLRWARELHALSHIGLTYSTENHFDQERYSRIREIAAEIMASHGEIGPATVLERWDQQDGYITPKVDVRAVVFDDSQRVLLVRERADGLWALPGGWADVNESAGQVVAREVREEACMEVRPVRLLAVYDRSLQGHNPPFAYHVYKIFFLCEVVAGTPQAGPEVLDAAWFAEDALPALSLSRVLPEQIRRMYEHLRDPSLPADFD